VYYAGIPFGYIIRQHFQESQILELYIRSEMQGMKITESDFYSGEFIRYVDELLSLPSVKRDGQANGAYQAARFIVDTVQ